MAKVSFENLENILSEYMVFLSQIFTPAGYTDIRQSVLRGWVVAPSLQQQKLRASRNLSFCHASLFLASYAGDKNLGNVVS